MSRRPPPYQITLTLSPNPPRALDTTVFTARVIDSENQPLAGAAATADLSMPDMTMPINTVTLVNDAPGVYHGTGRFTMTGKWLVTVDVNTKSQRQTVAFPVTVQ